MATADEIKFSPVSAVDPESALRVFDWTGIRPVYRRMNSEFWRLTRPFGIELTATNRLDLSVQIAVMDAIDRELDILAGAGPRSDFSRQVVRFLMNDSDWEYTCVTAFDLTPRLAAFKDTLWRLDVVDQVTAVATEVLSLTERKRTLTDRHAFLDCLEQEWRLAGRFPILMLGENSNERFENWFLAFCQAMHIFDTGLDLKSDFAAGEIRLRPGFAVYSSLLGRLLSRGPGLWFRFPAKWNLARYGMSMFRASLQH
jgi:hypothetical protein